MTTTIIITLCSLLLLAYLFDVSSAFTKIPTVILLLVLGWVVSHVLGLLAIDVPSLNAVLPILGTIGLILIVLEGALELEVNREKFQVIWKSFLIALIPMLALAFAVAYFFNYWMDVPFKAALLNVVPLAVISSSIAIPSSKNLGPAHREFVIYESSFSDIIGVLFFNFMVRAEDFTLPSFGQFGFQILIITVVSFLSVIALSFLLSRIKHHITYTPIILLVILIYGVSKVYHLPGLIFILIFGLFLGNLDELKEFKWISRLRPVKLQKEVSKFKEITMEATFLIKSLFFLLFGFLMEIEQIIDLSTLPIAIGIVLGIVLIRLAALLIFRLPLSPLLFFAPRGLITILLFLSIEPDNAIAIVNSSLIIQVIILSVFVMMTGSLVHSKKDDRGTPVTDLPK